ncbi:MAG TPA: polyhydroxyalkanoate synthesis regulator DNA-binding domain-containing protein [Anaerolineaceae bacterium]|nr:polyhydroxyalkanoate synthesis regulator DNA-binding domain-containing protein [Anaerolineaceae bacterium]HPN50738.1 polyhydroxyalkanoate synthesis regulator DNA-binding domain-containing protein [Anaerolineaceae bacterium]
MLEIKRYTNRKLYDSRGRRYITLDEIAGLVRNGEEVRVLDHLTGEDLTVQTLVQVILEEQKQGGMPLPLRFLTRLLRAGNDAVAAAADALWLARRVNDEILQRLVAAETQGALTPVEAERLRVVLVNPYEAEEPAPSENIRDLIRQVDALTAEVKALRQGEEE